MISSHLQSGTILWGSIYSPAGRQGWFTATILQRFEDAFKFLEFYSFILALADPVVDYSVDLVHIIKSNSCIVDVAYNLLVDATVNILK